jgi:hypothetical protein
MATSKLQPAPSAQQLAEDLLADRNLQQQLLAETINSGSEQRLEAGRTVCGIDGRPQPPRDRNTTSIELEPCRGGGPTGIYHTHPSASQLRSPDHSLPDYANVAFEGVDASVIVGSETASVVVAALDRPTQQQAMQNALGLGVESTRDVITAIRNDEIADPAAARQAVDNAFGTLSYTEPTGYDGITEQIRSGAVTEPAATTAGMPIEACTMGHSHGSATPRGAAVLRAQGRVGSQSVKQAINGANLGQTAANTAVGELAKAAVRGLLL